MSKTESSDLPNVTPLQYKIRWFMLGLFVLYSASNSLQWTQYAIISDIIVRYYGVSSYAVSWTSMVYMLTYVPLIFPGSWLLDKTAGRAGEAASGTARENEEQSSSDRRAPHTAREH
ncbi:unnamed protein product [Danaus chrysippus]|uniref:(African queen) hypothetical protein n=1 Tax=Danaus chrysippus TaxID=151541 RepID=A0A8J2R3R4_9NEOP|nr:unnamed protein product [Danaus chrysippus]